ncbi:hypothetical protein HBF26_09335 [Luteibacter jiangsuensis]|uniref:Co-chaperone DjlA N-terminal domain-containing protein n=1 Tax=Luteibacter jiangsuensis TaxID=637577 RepID=A0ABX0Q402_9GAMM|nr:hypothetical protein [Luteibacter jiangsuensis]NID05088.1 hypothetical protein [Luteibacter jiangsuensis]
MLDYDQLKLFFQVVVGVIFDPRHIEGDANPIRVLGRMEKESRALAAKGLRLGISDAISMLRDERPETIAALSAKLEEAGAPSIEMIRAYLSKKWAAIVKHGSIETDEQFYLVRELVDDPGLTSADRDRLNHMLDVYEAMR